MGADVVTYTLARMLPAAPLADLLRRWQLESHGDHRHGDHAGFEELSRRCGISDRTMHRILSGQELVHETVADKLVIGMGRHPVELWPEFWLADVEV